MNFAALTDYLDHLDERFGVPAADCAVYRDGRLVYRHMAGYSDAARTKPLTENTMYWVYSATKLYTCTAALQLVERGLVGLDDPVCKYIPEFAAPLVKAEGGLVPAERQITVRHLFTMTGGLNYDVATPAIVTLKKCTGDRATMRAVINAIAEAPLDFQPGSHFQYSLCHDVLAEVIAVVSGMKFEEYVAAHLIRPLGGKDACFFPTDEQYARFCAQYRYDEQSGIMTDIGLHNFTRICPTYAAGGGGLAATVQDYALLPVALSNYGLAQNGYRVLNPETVELMRKNHMAGVTQADFNRMKPTEYGYGLGVRTRIGGASRCPAGEFGWDGAAGFYTLVDTVNRVAVAHAQHVVDYELTYDVMHPAIRELIYEGLGL